MKYIIELGEDANMVQVISVTQSGNAYIDSLVYVGYLEQLNSDYINEHFGELQDTAYQKGLEDGKKAFDLLESERNSEYQRGFEDGKAVNDKGCEGCKMQGTDSNICDQCCNSYANQWKENDEKIVVGDEVKWNDDLVVITRFCDDPQWLDGIDKDGTAYHILKLNARKTGRHYDIGKILEEMKA